ncbi:hypothetical protein CYMTET_4891 [Cymbomonas tetramitiformis]|uniref:Uncharacterized protein n=1 Tax=Cymbomonas tetramitiformis TaxID=36881 RepID=A0AAE0H0J1_9CHLO|nr:hypothetical protein CYMTET_4891 [Cymbomonas tetramitiformis]
MTRLQVAASEATGVIVTERTWLPAKHVRTVHDAALTLEPEDQDQIRWLQACTYVMLAFVSFGRPATGTSLQQENVLMDEDGVTVVLNREKGKNHKLKKRQLSIPWWGVERLRESSGHGICVATLTALCHHEPLRCAPLPTILSGAALASTSACKDGNPVT